MNSRNLIHTAFLATYAGLNVGLYQLTNQAEFTVMGQFVLAPLFIIIGAAVLFAMDQYLVAMIAPETELAAELDNTSPEAAVQTATIERRVHAGKRWAGRKDRRRSVFQPPMATGV